MAEGLLSTMAFLAYLVGTFAWLRVAALLVRKGIVEAVLRSDVPWAHTVRFAGTSITIAALAWAADAWSPIPGFSPEAVVLSIALDLAVQVGHWRTWRGVARRRRDPSAFDRAVVVSDRRVGSLVEARIGTSRSRQVILTPDAARALVRGDVRLVEAVSPEDGIGLEVLAAMGAGDLARQVGVDEGRAFHLGLVPHFPLGEPPEGSATEAEPLDGALGFHQLAQRARGRSAAWNRVLQASLPDELWATTLRLASLSPRVVAQRWKLFHVQESVRMRIVLLHNTVELCARLLAISLLVDLRRVGDLEPLWPRLSRLLERGRWLEILELVARREADVPLPVLRALAVGSRPDIGSFDAALAPFAEVLGARALARQSDDLLGMLWTLQGLRNALLGHGGVGRALDLDAPRWLGAYYRAVLTALREVAEVGIGIGPLLRGEAPGEPDAWSLDEGPFGLVPHDGVTDAMMLSTEAVDATPWLTYCSGSLLVLHQVRGMRATYVDYGSTSIQRPSLIRREVPPEAFWTAPAPVREPAPEGGA